MSTTITYKGNTIATVDNTTKTLQTEGKYMEGNVVITDVSHSAPTLQAKTNITPTTSSQTITADSGYDGLSSVQINAMPSGIAVPAASITGTSAILSSGTNQITLTKSVTNTPQVTAGYISSGTGGNTSVSLTASVITQSAQIYTPTTSNQTIPSGCYLTGTQTIKGDANLLSENIRNGVSIFNVSGSYSGGTVIKGTFTGTSTGALEINLGYTGTGYIRHLCIYPNLNTTPIQSDIVAPHWVIFIVTESDDTVPNYNNNKYAYWTVVFKQKSDNPLVSYVNSSGATHYQYFYDNTPATDGSPYVSNSVHIRSNTLLSVFINSADSGLFARGFQKDIEYVYEAYYKE